MKSDDGTHKLTAEEVLARYNDETYPDFCDPLTDVNQIGTFGNRPIHMASYRGAIKELKALVSAGAEINVVGEMGSTPLHEAVRGRHLEAVRFLLGHCADVTARDEFGHTPLELARIEGQYEIIALLEAADPTGSGK